MKVKLAAEVLSSSVADALEYLIDKDERFKDAQATVHFIRTCIVSINIKSQMSKMELSLQVCLKTSYTMNHRTQY